MKLTVLERLLSGYSERLPDRYVVVSEQRVRFAQRQ